MVTLWLACRLHKEAVYFGAYFATCENAYISPLQIHGLCLHLVQRLFPYAVLWKEVLIGRCIVLPEAIERHDI